MSEPTATGLRRAIAAALALTLGGCGGGSFNATIGGGISGLAAGTSVVLQNNGADNLTINANGNFSFATAVGANGSYAITVLTQPTGQLCTVGNGSGSVDSRGDNVNSVTVVCVSNTTLQGTVAGLNPGTAVWLSNGTVLLPVAANGAFSFPGAVAIGAAYTVSIATQPVGELCTVTNGTGTVPASGSVNVTVTCAPG